MAARKGNRILVIGAGLAGLAAAERLLDAGLQVTILDAFPVPGGRTASFDVATPVAGLVPGDVVEHGLHAWFQHYHALFGLMARAGIPKPPFAGDGIHFWNAREGHVVVEGGPLFWLLNALQLPTSMRGQRRQALSAFLRLIRALDDALARAEQTDVQSAGALLRQYGVPQAAIDAVFAPCMYSLTSLPLDRLSALEMLRWMSRILPDPRIRVLQGGGTSSMGAPILERLRARGADVRLGVEVHRIALGRDGRAQLALAQAPDRTGVRHVLVPGFQPAEPPDPEDFDAVVCSLPWERLYALTSHDAALQRHEAWLGMAQLRNIHPLSIRLWFERPIEGTAEHYILSSDTLFDVLRPTPEPDRYPGVHLIDLLVENVDTHLPELAYRHERYLEPGPLQTRIVQRMLADLERMYPGQIRDNRVLRSFLHTREGIVACHPGTWRLRAPQHIGSPYFVLAGDWTRQPYGVCMEGAVRSGQLAAQALLDGRNVAPTPWAFGQVAYSVRSLFERA